jgi:deoxyribonuclease-2
MTPLNEAGQPVDWWFSYKVPKLHGQTTGYEYLYHDADSKAPCKSEYRIDRGEGAINHTLAQALSGTPSDTLGYILYNDERPDGAADNGGLGHTKGCLVWDTASGQGFWLLHSWPLFPATDLFKTQKYPTPIYGQTKLCLALTLESLDAVAGQMIHHQEPQVYATKVPTGTSESLAQLAAGASPNDPADSNVLSLTTVGGMAFQVIAKNRKWNDDYWNDLVGPILGVDMDVETWIRGPIAPTEDKGGIFTTADIKFVNAGALGESVIWPETADHAKWGISSDPTKPYVVVADINRMISQRNRGGGGIAFLNLQLWLALKQSAYIVAPSGMSRADAHAHLKTSHEK